jgi:hypothetical protein
LVIFRSIDRMILRTIQKKEDKVKIIFLIPIY